MKEQQMYLARNWKPDVDLVLSNGVSIFGIKGSGKTSIVMLLIEQFARFLLPQIVFDTEDEYRSLVDVLPHGVACSLENIPSASDILSYGLQVIINLQSGTPERAAVVMTNLLTDLFTVASTQPTEERVPVALFLDEAGYWLPQSKTINYLSKETRRELLSIFSQLGSRGRKYGLVPFLATQFISQVDKDVIRQTGIRFFMRQTQDNDITRYGQYMKLTPERKLEIASFEAGEAIIHGLADGSIKHVCFNEPSTPNVSCTPKVNRAIARYANSTVDYTAIQQEQATKTTKKGYATEKIAHTKRLLREHPEMPASQIARETGYDLRSVYRLKNRLASTK